MLKQAMVQNIIVKTKMIFKPGLRTKSEGRYFLTNSRITAKSTNSKVYRKAPAEIVSVMGFFKGALRIFFYVLAVIPHFSARK
jgi:hypothetical protein